MKKQAKSNKLPVQTIALYTLAALVLLQFVLLGVLYNGTREMFVMNQDSQDAIAGSTYSMIQAVAYKQATVVPSDGMVYFPEARIKLPMTDETVKLAYDMRVDGSKDGPRELYDVSTWADATTNWADKNCVPVRLTFEAAPNPFNPKEVPQPPVTLADGRTLQIYASKDANCNMRWGSTKLDPVKLAEVFQRAQAY